MNISFHTLGDEAILINFEQRIDESINREVHHLTRSIELLELSSIKYITPAYCSITVVFDKDKISFNTLKIQFEKLANSIVVESDIVSRKLYIPVCYDRSFALDLDEIELQTRLSTSEIIKTHTSIIYKTYMIGFLPGFPYLGKLPKEMNCGRKPLPRPKVLKGAVAIAGLQTGIYPEESPGGWQIVGNTPVDLSSTNRNQPFLFQAGDEVQFYSISKNKHTSILKEQKQGNFSWNNVYE